MTSFSKFKVLSPAMISSNPKRAWLIIIFDPVFQCDKRKIAIIAVQRVVLNIHYEKGNNQSNNRKNQGITDGLSAFHKCNAGKQNIFLIKRDFEETPCKNNE